MPTWKDEMHRQAEYVRQIRPDAYTMPLPEDKKKQPAEKPKEPKQDKPVEDPDNG